ncbi:hypothetical protein DENSPDRAFT_849975 [Dentipellis sp. KUC8613]|nr:hypothetical protein DENSPDRAFT_849975 [Dentipellis sp. KUC8613]
MSPPGPIKAFPKRLYTVLPRAPPGATSRTRSNSLSSSSGRSLYTAPPSSLNSLGFFDTPPPPGKPNNHGHSPLTPSRLPPHAKSELEAPNPPDSPTHPPSSQSSHSSHSSNGGNGNNGGNGAPPSSLALTSTSPSSHSTPPHHSLPPSTHNPPFFPYTPFSPPSASTSAPDSEAELAAQAVRPGPHKHRPKYHFDVGAYGIPKRGARAGTSSSPLWSVNNGNVNSGSRVMDGLDLAVQVGEDAYFVRENAMGVADGVGGWSRCKSSLTGPMDPSPSALFARRLMHFCSAEVASSTAASFNASAPTPSVPPYPPTTFTFHPSSSYVPFQPPASPASHPVSLDSVAEEADECDDAEYDDLEEGLDILLILERAYERALKAHVVPSPSPSASSNASRSSSTTHTSTPSPSPEPVPLMAGSSTALLAVLDHAGPSPPAVPFSSPSPTPAPAPTPNMAGDSRIEDCDAVIRIAHLGDCMGMLVRGDEIVWRSDEMWWAFNTPLQLGPSTRTPPSTAQILTVPVRADDILILASDGLSDNLWDEDVLDEVSRFRRGFLGASRSPSPASTDAWAPSGGLLGRRTLAGMLSEALCSRARRVAEGRGRRDDEIPFARRAREEGRVFRGGKADDISVLVAVISPAESERATVP